MGTYMYLVGPELDNNAVMIYTVILWWLWIRNGVAGQAVLMTTDFSLGTKLLRYGYRAHWLLGFVAFTHQSYPTMAF